MRDYWFTEDGGGVSVADLDLRDVDIESIKATGPNSVSFRILPWPKSHLSYEQACRGIDMLHGFFEPDRREPAFPDPLSAPIGSAALTTENPA